MTAFKPSDLLGISAEAVSAGASANTWSAHLSWSSHTLPRALSSMRVISPRRRTLSESFKVGPALPFQSFPLPAGFRASTNRRNVSRRSSRPPSVVQRKLPTARDRNNGRLVARGCFSAVALYDDSDSLAGVTFRLSALASIFNVARAARYL